MHPGRVIQSSVVRPSDLSARRFRCSPRSGAHIQIASQPLIPSALGKAAISSRVARATGGATGAGWVPGQSGNPAGRPRDVLEKLTKDVIIDLANDWHANGKQAIADLRNQDVSTYVQVCVSLIPKEVHIAAGPLKDLSDEELSALVFAAKKAIAKANAS
jgi:hypothetical protein